MAKEFERDILQYIAPLSEAEKKKVPDISIEQYNKEIDEAVARVAAGEYYTQQAKEW